MPEPVPPAPLQYTVYPVVVVRLPVLNDPDVPEPPPYADEHDVALVDVQDTVELELYPTDDGEAEIETVAGPTHIDPFQAVPLAHPTLTVC